jgi:ABC-2 type transport system permease protein
VDVNPISHLTTSARGLMSGDAEADSILISLLSAGVLTAVFAPLTVRLYRKA